MAANEQLLREIAIEMQEMEDRHQKEISALRRKLRIALGDIKPRKCVVEFRLPNGKSFKIDE